MISKLIFFTFLISFSSFSQDNIRGFDQELDNQKLEEFEKGHSQKETNLNFIDADSGIIRSYSTKSDQRRFSFTYQVSARPKNLLDFNGFEFTYATRQDSFWWEFYFLQASTSFSTIARANPANHPETEEYNAGSQSIISLGTGASYRTRMIQSIFGTKKIFESTTLLVTYNRLQEKFYSESYRGVGLKTDLGLHYRYTEDIQLGLKLGYNTALVQRSVAYTQEPDSQRVLSLYWSSLGLDFALYF